MAKQKLDLVCFAASIVTEPGASPPKIMGSKFVDPCSRRILFDHVPDYLLAQPVTPNRASTGDPAKDPAAGNSGSMQPIVNEFLHPVRHRNRSNVSGLADQVNDGPVVLALLQMRNV